MASDFKVYWSDGAQLPPHHADAIAKRLEEIDIFDGVKRMDFEEAVKSGLIETMGDETDRKFMANVTAMINDRETVAKVADTFKLVYTPFHGCGYKLVPEALTALGIKHLIPVPEQMVIDGNFPTVVSPNPENPEGFYLAVELAKKMGDDESIVGVLGPMTSSEAIACAPVFEEYTMVELSPCASNNQYAPMSDYAFTVAGKMEAEQPYLVERGAYEYLNAKSIGVIWVNDDWGASAFESTKEGCEEYGIEITDDESFVSGEKDFTAILTKIRQTNPEYLMLVTQAADGALILKQLEAMGWDIPVIGAGAMYSDQVILLAGEAAEGLVISAGFFLSEEDEIAWDYATKFYEGAGFYPTTHGPLSYDAALLLCAAIEKAGTTDRQAVRDALAGITDADVQALWGDVLLAGPYEFTEDEDIIRAYCLLKIVDGKWTKVSDYSKCSKFE